MYCKYCNNEIPKKHIYEKIFNIRLWDTIKDAEYELEVDLGITGFCQKCSKSTDTIEKHFIREEDLEIIINAKKEQTEL